MLDSVRTEMKQREAARPRSLPSEPPRPLLVYMAKATQPKKK